MERALSRALPQIPWPEVHPLPIEDPKPTSSPLTTARSSYALGGKVWMATASTSSQHPVDKL